MVLGSLHFVPLAAAAPALQVTLTPTPESSLAGTNGSLEVVLTNTGTTGLSGPRIRLGDVGPGLEVEEQSWSVERMEPGQVTTIQIPFSVRADAEAGYHPLNLQIRYCDNTECADTNRFALITVRALDSLVLEELRPTRLEPGQEQTMAFVLRNNGAGPLLNLVATWTSRDQAILPLGSGDTFVISRLEASNGTEIEVPVTTASDQKVGLYTVTLEARYTDGAGLTLTSTLVAGILIGGPAEFGVSLQEWDHDRLSLSLSNVGVSPARSVGVRILEGPMESLPAETVLLGTLDPGDFTTVAFGADRSPGREEVLRIEVEYTDSDGERRTTTNQVPVGSQGLPQEDEGGGVPWLWIVVLAVAGAVGYLGYRKWKQRKAERQDSVTDSAPGPP